MPKSVITKKGLFPIWYQEPALAQAGDRNKLISLFSLFVILLISLPAYADDLSIISASPNDLVIQFEMPELEIDKKEVNGQIFHLLSFRDCGFTSSAGRPKVPTRSVMLGIPEKWDPSVTIISASYDLKAGYRLCPVEEEMSDTLSPATVGRVEEFYPSSLVSIEPTGYIRQQRVARLQICPVQFNPSTGQIKIYKKLQVRVVFRSASTYSPSKQTAGLASEPDGAYEELYKEILLNYEQARNWRLQRVREAGESTGHLAPEVQRPSYKITVEKNGIYRLDYDYLVRTGIDPTMIDPQKIELQSGGKQIPIYVEGYQDGSFDRGDFIEFYGVKSDSIYTNSNVYWLSFHGLEDPGTRSWMMAVKDGMPKTPNLTPPSAFLCTEHFEEDKEYDPLKRVTTEGADHFFWKPMRGQDPRYNSMGPYPINLPFRAPNINASFKLRACFQGVTFAKGASKHKIKIYLNSTLLSTAEWEGQIEYISETTINQSEVHRYNWLTLECEDNNGTNDSTDPKWDVYLNWIEVDYWHEFSTDGDMLEFSTDTIPQTFGTAHYTIKGFSRPDIEIFQIDKASAIAKIVNFEIAQGTGGTYTVTFEDNVTQPTRYYVTCSSRCLRPESLVKDQPSTLHDPANRVDYIMISHRNFLDSTKRLADFRRKQGLDVLVVDVEDVFDEFSYGVFDPKAIKRFLRYAYFNWDKIPTYVLLVGDAHWDYKYVYDMYYRKYENYPRIYVPTYHAWSLPYGETAMDHRFVTVSGDDILPDMMIGRIPANTAKEADNAIDKIIAYESNPSFGLWQTKIMLIADDDKSKSGDEVFEDSRVDLANNYIPVGYEVVDVYLRRIGEPYLARKIINAKINEGVVMLEYSGHGGAYSWAHELIFDSEDVKRLRNPYYPFVVTTTCENGYFDNPQGGNKTLIELFLLEPNKGAVACFSATRLTYGQGNAVFDKMLYPRVFNEKPPILGKIVNAAKIDFIKLDIPAWVSSAEQYTLFGDPATKLALPEMNIECELARSSVDVSKKIELKSGSVKRLKPNPTTSEKTWVTDTEFSAQMLVSVVYPNNLDEDRSNDLTTQIETVKIWNGEFGKVSLSIPSNVIPGEGRLRFYAYTKNTSAIGGIRFSISVPVVEFISSKIVNDESLQVFVAITDNLGESGIKSVECEWRNTETWKSFSYPMIRSSPPPDSLPKVEGSWYVIKDNIPLSKPGTSIDYRIIVIDTEGNQVITNYESVKVPIGINLAISRPIFYAPPDISYTYSQVEGSWILSVPVENNGSKEVRQTVAIYFFEGNPDKNADNVVDQDAKLLGSTVILYEHWERADVVRQKTIARVKLDKPLTPGFHQIFVWINPKVTSLHAIPGVSKIEDADESDNKGSKLFQINEFLVGKSDAQAQSLDGILTIWIPESAVSETVMSVTELDLPESDWKQPDLTSAPLPTSDSYSPAFKIQLTSGETRTKKPVRVSIRFSVMEIRNMAKKLRGLAEKDENQLTPAERAWIESGMQEEAKKLGIYIWQENTRVWKYLPSELVMKEKEFAQEYYVPLPISENRSDVQLSAGDIVIDEIATPIGDWVIFFLDSKRYKVYFRREGSTSYENLGRYGVVGELYENKSVNLQLNINKGEKDFGFGDVFRFSTYQEMDGTIKLKNLRSYNDGDGTVQVTPMDGEDAKRQVGKWAIFFVEKTKFEIHSQDGRPLLDGEGLPLVGNIGKLEEFPTIGVKVEINSGRYHFQFGDKFVFETLFTGIVQAQTNSLGTLSLMHSDDSTLPTIQLWVNGLPPKSGAVIPPRPSISMLLSDINGIDMDSFSFLVSVNDRDFQPVPKEDYAVSERSQLDNIPLFYSPLLKIGKYRYRISVKDLNGNSARSDSNEYLELVFLVEEKPDVSPPKIEVTADGQVIMNNQIFRKSPEFIINISDDSALDESSVLVSMAYEDEPLEPLERNEYLITFSNDLKKAKIVYAPHLMNGEYAIQVQATDTNNNSAYLSPPEIGPLKFRVDEKVEVKDIMNAPNPFSDTTVFSYWLTQPADRVTIKIYTLKGRMVRVLDRVSPKWQYNEEFWDGRDEDRNKLASGVYFYKFIVTDGDRKIEKVGKLAIVR